MWNETKWSLPHSSHLALGWQYIYIHITQHDLDSVFLVCGPWLGLSIVTIVRMLFHRARLLVLEIFVSNKQIYLPYANGLLSIRRFYISDECWLAQLSRRRRHFYGKFSQTFLSSAKTENRTSGKSALLKIYAAHPAPGKTRCVNKILANGTCSHFSDTNSTFRNHKSNLIAF